MYIIIYIIIKSDIKIVKYRKTRNLLTVSQGTANVGLQSKFDIFFNYANEAVWRKRGIENGNLT